MLETFKFLIRKKIQHNTAHGPPVGLSLQQGYNLRSEKGFTWWSLHLPLRWNEFTLIQFRRRENQNRWTTRVHIEEDMCLSPLRLLSWNSRDGMSKTTDVYFSLFWSLEAGDQDAGQFGFWLRALFVVRRWCPSRWVLTWSFLIGWWRWRWK